jgi:DNA-binding response OmpR family regulator
MSPTVLVVDDEAHIRELICLYLRQAGFETMEADNGRLALETAKTAGPDLIILDLMLPERDGWEVCREVRAWGDTPIIMLTAREAETEKLLGFALGADDYVTKPFQPRELVARVRAVLKRAGDVSADPANAVTLPTRESEGGSPGAEVGRPVAPAAAGDTASSPEAQRLAPILDFGAFSLNRLSRELEVRGEIVNCPAKEFDLLWLLASHPDRVFGREELLERVWSYQYYGDLRTVDVHIRRIRQKIEAHPDEPRFIHTVWGIGYKFKAGRDACGDSEPV